MLHARGMHFLAHQPCEPCQPNAKTSRTRQMLAVSSTLASKKGRVLYKRAAIPPQQLKSTRKVGIHASQLLHQQAQALVSPIITRSSKVILLRLTRHSNRRNSNDHKSRSHSASSAGTQPQPHEPSPSFAALPARLPSKTHQTAQIERSVMKADRFAGRVPLRACELSGLP
jgi:hypothetical protein